MSERYFITGVQLGILLTADKKEIERVINNIIDKQFICNLKINEYRKFEKEMKNLQTTFVGENNGI